MGVSGSAVANAFFVPNRIFRKARHGEGQFWINVRRTHYEYRSSALPSNSDNARRRRHFAFVPIREVAVSSIGEILRGLVWRESTAQDIARSPFNFALEHHRMTTCYLRYEVDPDKLADFEAYSGDFVLV